MLNERKPRKRICYVPIPGGVASFLLFAGIFFTACQSRQFNIFDEESQSRSASPTGTAAPSATPAAALGHARDKVIVQLFDWPFREITAEMAELARLGYGRIHVSPPQLSIARKEWWGRYQPVDYRVIEGPLGNEDEFKEMNAAADKHGIDIIVDVVFNHMANPDMHNHDSEITSAPEVLDYPGAALLAKYGLPGPLFDATAFHDGFCTRNYSDRNQVLNGRLCGKPQDKGLPDLDHTKDFVVKAQKEYLARLRGYSVDGFRIDAVKHMPPAAISKVFDPADFPADMLLFGEIIADVNSFDDDLEPYLRDTRLAYYDFPLLTTLRGAFAFGGSLKTLVDPVGAKGALADDRAITFVANHDMPQNGATFAHLFLYPRQNRVRLASEPAPDRRDEALAYAFLFARKDGVPYVYSDRGMAGGLQTDDYKNEHRRSDLAAMIAFRKAVVGTPQALVWESPETLGLARGDSAFAFINKSGLPFTKTTLDLPGLKAGTYTDLLSGNTVRVAAGKVKTFEIAARSAALFVLKK